MAVDLPHERRCSCDHLAFEHAAASSHACAAPACDCRSFTPLTEVDLLGWS